MEKSVKIIQDKFKLIRKTLNERGKRLWAATEASALGWGGITRVAEATGLSRTTITSGLNELKQIKRKRKVDNSHVRQPGGGRKRLSTQEPGIITALERMLSSATRGDPESPLLWTSRSTRQLADALNKRGYRLCDRTVAHILEDLGYSLQATRKVNEGKQHPDRDAQFKYLYKQIKQFQKKHDPVISVDAKKKELIGNFEAKGTQWRKKGDVIEVNAYDYPSLASGKAIPYGVYDLTNNEGWVSVGTDHETAEFAASTILHWWLHMGQKQYPKATQILITADCGGSNRPLSSQWHIMLQHLSNRLGIAIKVCHFPPGTSKWNKIEHAMFSYITKNWHGRPLTSYEVMVKLIGSTKTTTGLQVKAKLDRKKYPTGIQYTDEAIESVNITRDRFHGDWNYQIDPI